MDPYDDEETISGIVTALCPVLQQRTLKVIYSNYMNRDKGKVSESTDRLTLISQYINFSIMFFQYFYDSKHLQIINDSSESEEVKFMNALDSKKTLLLVSLND